MPIGNKFITYDMAKYLREKLEEKIYVLIQQISGGEVSTGYYTELENMLGAKQDALTAGDNVSIATVNGVLTISATDTDTTYSAGTGLSLSGTTFSNSAPNVKSDWNAAAGTDAEILNKPTIPSYSVAVASSAGVGGSNGLMSAEDKEKLDDSNAGRRVQLFTSNGTNLKESPITVSGYTLTDFSAIEIRYQAYLNSGVVYGKTLRAVKKDDGFGIVAAEKYESSSNTLNLFVCGLTLSGSTVTLTYPNGVGSFTVYQIYGYK